MGEDNKKFLKKIPGLKRLFEELNNEEAIYYQKIAKETGKRRLRETDQLSKIIIENKRSMENLAKVEKLLNNSFNSIHGLLTVQNKNLQVLISNWHNCDYISPEERLSHPYCYNAYMNRETPCEPCHVLEIFETGKRKRFEETDPANGTTKEINSYPVFDNTFDVVAVVVYVRDITELRLAEEEKKKHEEKLHQVQKMEAIGTLAGEVAHDLNNVLSGIVSYPDLLLMQISDNSPLRKSILAIQESGNKAAAIVQDLLTLARKGVVVNKILNLNEIINEYQKCPEYEKLRSFHPYIEIETRLKKDLLNIKGSPIHLTRAIANLISNAAESIGESGKITILTENRHIDRFFCGYENIDVGDYVAFVISDTGAGISNDDIRRVFEPFYIKKKMRKNGMGFGMAVVWGILKDHNGYIDVQSAFESGTRFTLFFPATDQKTAESDTVFSIQNYMSKGESILVVDDVKQQREIASTILKKLGYSVFTASSGEETIEFFGKNSVDLLVLDMIMGSGMDGLDTYRQVLKLNSQQKAIITSGFSETERVKKAQELGAGQYIKKPYTLEKIGIAVRYELDKK